MADDYFIPIYCILPKRCVVKEISISKRWISGPSFATNTALERSDIDFAVKGCKDILKLEDAVEKIETLRKIDVVDYLPLTLD